MIFNRHIWLASWKKGSYLSTLQFSESDLKVCEFGIWNVKIAARKRRSYFVGCNWSTFFVHIHCFNWVPIWKTSCICLKGTHSEFSAENWHPVCTYIQLKQLRMLWMILLSHLHVRTCSVVISLGLTISAYFHLQTVQMQYMYQQRYFLQFSPISHRIC